MTDFDGTYNSDMDVLAYFDKNSDDDSAFNFFEDDDELDLLESELNYYIDQSDGFSFLSDDEIHELQELQFKSKELKEMVDAGKVLPDVLKELDVWMK